MDIVGGFFFVSFFGWERGLASTAAVNEITFNFWYCSVVAIYAKSTIYVTWDNANCRQFSFENLFPFKEHLFMKANFP